MFGKEKHNNYFSDLRQRLEEYAGMKERQTGWYETREPEERRNLFDYYPFSALWHMHRFLLLKTVLVLFVITVVFGLNFLKIPFASAVLQNINYLTTVETNFVQVGQEALPTLQRLWTGSVEQELESPVFAPPAHREGEGVEEPLNLSLPLQGEKVRGYGLIEDSSGKMKMLYGVLLGTHGERPVYAAAAGTVKEVKRVDRAGFNLTLLHGHGIETSYGYLQEVSVSEKDVVGQRDKIGYTGTEELEGWTVLYFELRENGRPVDPIPLLRSGGN